MTDSYQAVYDAVRSQIRYCDSHNAIKEAIGSGFDASHAIAIVQQEFCIAAGEMQRPSVLYRPQLFVAQNQWCAIYGGDSAPGVAGFGDTPAAAMAAFDAAWINQKPQGMKA